MKEWPRRPPPEPFESMLDVVEPRLRWRWGRGRSPLDLGRSSCDRFSADEGLRRVLGHLRAALDHLRCDGASLDRCGVHPPGIEWKAKGSSSSLLIDWMVG